jgi:hypothetical protein
MAAAESAALVAHATPPGAARDPGRAPACVLGVAALTMLLFLVGSMGFLLAVAYVARPPAECPTTGWVWSGLSVTVGLLSALGAAVINPLLGACLVPLAALYAALVWALGIRLLIQAVAVAACDALFVAWAVFFAASGALLLACLLASMVYAVCAVRTRRVAVVVVNG